MFTVATGESYTVKVDETGNRIHIKMVGDIYQKEKFESLPDQMRQACRMLKTGFTCLADFGEVTLLALPDVALSVQQTLMEEDVKKVAVVWAEQLLAKMALNKSADSVGDQYVSKRKVFTDMNEAAAWLDE